MRALPGASATFSDSAFELLPSVGIRSQIPLAELIIYLIMPENPFSLSAFNFRSPPYHQRPIARRPNPMMV